MSTSQPIKDKSFVKQTGRRYEAPCPNCGEIFTLSGKERRGEEPFECWVEGCKFNERFDFRKEYTVRNPWRDEVKP